MDPRLGTHEHDILCSVRVHFIVGRWEQPGLMNPAMEKECNRYLCCEQEKPFAYWRINVLTYRR
jgi:hypothetical protein